MQKIEQQDAQILDLKNRGQQDDAERSSPHEDVPEQLEAKVSHYFVRYICQHVFYYRQCYFIAILGLGQALWF